MDDAELFARMHASLRAFYRVIAAGSPSSRLIEKDDLVAAVVPVTPSRSVFNGVVYESPSTLADSLDDLGKTYRDAGVDAWTVWVPARDADTAAVLVGRGHALDADPAAMALELGDFEAKAWPGIEIDDAAPIGEVAAINDAAYGYDGDFARGLAELPADAARLYVARSEGRAVASTVAFDHDGDCCITFVATLSEARGRGLATALMTRALLDARDRGCETTTLQATKQGQPVYERMGYRDLGPLQMWEFRKG